MESLEPAGSALADAGIVWGDETVRLGSDELAIADFARKARLSDEASLEASLSDEASLEASLTRFAHLSRAQALTMYHKPISSPFSQPGTERDGLRSPRRGRVD